MQTFSEVLRFHVEHAPSNLALIGQDTGKMKPIVSVFYFILSEAACNPTV